MQYTDYVIILAYNKACVNRKNKNLLPENSWPGRWHMGANRCCAPHMSPILLN